MKAKKIRIAEHFKKILQEKYIMYFAITSIFYAISASIVGLLSSYYSNLSMIEQIHSSDFWSYYQAKSIKLNVTELRLDLLELSKTDKSNDMKNSIIKYKNELSDLNSKANQNENNSKIYMQKNMSFSRSAALFQISIGVVAIAILIRKSSIWYFSMLIALFGILFFLNGLYLWFDFTL